MRFTERNLIQQFAVHNAAVASALAATRDPVSALTRRNDAISAATVGGRPDLILQRRDKSGT
jgi:hypothetical protein